MYMRAIVGALEHDDEEHNHRQSHLADVMDFGGFLRLNDVTKLQSGEELQLSTSAST